MDRSVHSGAVTTTDVDVLVVGAGITGIYQLHRCLEEGFTCRVVEAGEGVGGTWFWNRYPGARFDSESYTYGFLFSKELFEEWEWEEHFAGQPEIERYLNHVVDRFDLRRHMQFGRRVTSAVFDEGTDSWSVTTDDGSTTTARYVVSATGVLSIPYLPEVPGRETFGGVQHHTGRWPAEPVDFQGKRVGVVGTSSSGVQVISAVADEVESLIVYQRSANWCTPLNNRPITPEEQEQLRADFENLVEVLRNSPHGFHHPLNPRSAFDDPPDERLAFFETMWSSPGFVKFTSNYMDIMSDPAANAEWCEFIAGKIRSIVDDPATAEKLIPKDHRYGDKRPPYVTGYFEAFNRPNVSLVDLRETPMVRVTEEGIETTAGFQPLDVIVWATGFDFGTGAMLRMGIRGRGGHPLEQHWEDGPTTYLGIQTHGFPNLFFPGGPHGAAGNNPRYNSDQVDFVTDLLVAARDRGVDVIEPTAEAEARWMSLMEKAGARTTFGKIGQYVGGNVPGKPTRYQLNAAGRPKLLEIMTTVAAGGYAEFGLTEVARSA
jgi:cation diffusion facilitator CzcD-associated flavoprotein CzcO